MGEFVATLGLVNETQYRYDQPMLNKHNQYLKNNLAKIDGVLSAAGSMLYTAYGITIFRVAVDPSASIREERPGGIFGQEVTLALQGERPARVGWEHALYREAKREGERVSTASIGSWARWYVSWALRSGRPVLLRQSAVRARIVAWI